MSNIKKHICILDDDKSIRWVLEKAFQKENFMVSSFPDAESILKDFDTINPDIVLSDIRMPGISGIDLMDKLKGELLATKSKVSLVKCDLSNSSEIKYCVKEAIQKYGCPSCLLYTSDAADE